MSMVLELLIRFCMVNQVFLYLVVKIFPEILIIFDPHLKMKFEASIIHGH